MADDMETLRRELSGLEGEIRLAQNRLDWLQGERQALLGRMIRQQQESKHTASFEIGQPTEGEKHGT